MSASPTVCRFGILGTAGISAKNWLSIANAENAELVAVASRDAAKAEAFIDACQASRPVARRPEALGSYDALLARDDILPHALHIAIRRGADHEDAAGGPRLARRNVELDVAEAVVDARLSISLDRAATHRGKIGSLREMMRRLGDPPRQDFAVAIDELHEVEFVVGVEQPLEGRERGVVGREQPGKARPKITFDPER